MLTYTYLPSLKLSSVVSSLGVTLVSGAAYNQLGLPTAYAIGASPAAVQTQIYWGADLNAPSWTRV